jgi:lipid-A-disaccharide synthase
VPLLLATADDVRRRYPQVQFVIPVAPTLTPAAIAQYADPHHNPMVAVFQSPSTTLVPAGDQVPLPYLKTAQGTQIFLWQPFPAHAVTRQCDLCLTTVGANTAELGALGIPMVVLLPTQQLDAMNAWDGILGLLVNLPGIGKPLNRLVNWAFLSYVQRRGKRFAWPNLWAGREVVPELLGAITPQQVADRVVAYLNEPDRLQAIAADLRQVRGPGGAAEKLADLILRTAALDLSA